MKLTAEQKQIVGHNEGAALVFAVAGSGKTTSMVHRIKRLVSNKVCPANKILATSFSRATVDDIQKVLKSMNVQGVQTCTLHALGFRIIRLAADCHYIPKEYIKIHDNQEFLGDILARIALNKLRGKHRKELEQLKVEEEDFKTQISIWKANIQYADLDLADLTAAALNLAQQAQHENPYYIEAYQMYEWARQQNKWLTFDDMLLLAWEVLVKYPDILQHIQSKYEMVMVDEFQDVNKVQYHLLDLLVKSHGNYMVIGDDDQCIYEWRGANPSFILNFEAAYNAQKYIISDNFRSTGHQVILANQVIHQNKNRHPKKLSLTQGFEGNAYIMTANNLNNEAKILVDEIFQKRKEGLAFTDMAILIRLYNQTPMLEAEMIHRKLYYKIVGSTPFYKRNEIDTLLKYLRFAYLENSIIETGKFLEGKVKQNYYIKFFKAIILAPKKFLSKAIIDEICRTALFNKKSVLDILVEKRGELYPRVRQSVDSFLDLMEFITQNLQAPAHEVLEHLVKKSNYLEHLQTLMGSDELAELKYENVQAFIKFAKIRGNCVDLMQFIKHISQDYEAFHKEGNDNFIQIMTVFRAKGLEWDTVFIPDCNQGIFPYLRKDHTPEDMEAERRLFYVGVTRAKKNLYLAYTKSDNDNKKAIISNFLAEVDSEMVISDAYDLKNILNHPPNIINSTYQEQLIGYIHKYPLEKYFKQWFPHGAQLHLEL